MQPRPPRARPGLPAARAAAQQRTAATPTRGAEQEPDPVPSAPPRPAGDAVPARPRTEPGTAPRRPGGARRHPEASRPDDPTTQLSARPSQLSSISKLGWPMCIVMGSLAEGERTAVLGCAAPTGESVAPEVDGQNPHHGVRVAARSLGGRWVELVVDPSCASDLVVDGLGVPGPLRRGVLALHHAGGTDLRLLTCRHRHVIPELLPVGQAYPAGQLIPDAEVLAVHEDPEHWPGQWPPPRTTGGDMGAVSTRSRVTPPACRPPPSHPPPPRSRFPPPPGPPPP